MTVPPFNAGDLLVELEMLSQCHPWNRGIYLRNYNLERFHGANNGNSKLLCRFLVKNALVTRTDVRIQTSNSSAKMRHLSPQNRKLSGPRENRKGVRRNVLSHRLNGGLRVFNRTVFGQPLLDRIQPREDCRHGNNGVSEGNLGFNVIPFLASFCFPFKLAIREQHCKESDDRCDPATHCGDSGPIQVAFFAPLNARNQILEFAQQQLPLRPKQHSATLSARMEAAHA